MLFTIFVTFTFSAGMPVLYLSNFVILFIQYWVDKWLVFNFYRLTPQFTKELSMFSTSMLPLTVFMHFGGGLLMFGYPQFYGNQDQEDERMWQLHILIYWILSSVIVVIFLFEGILVDIWRYVSNAAINCWGL